MAKNYPELQNIALSKFGSTFLDKVNAISARLKIHPAWLLAVMYNESGMNPQAYNSQGGATGLIQIMPGTASGLGTSTQALMSMSATQQLDYVERYFAPYKGKLKSVVDMYIINFYPYALGKSDSYVLGSEQSNAYAQTVGRVNRGFDLNQNGYVTLGEVKRYTIQKYGTLPSYGFLGLGISSEKVMVISGVVLLIAILVVYYFRKEIFGFYHKQAQSLENVAKNIKEKVV
ncbi:hypothetical protein BKI52_02745 [marine bacterium AO1-C]|nr:hypothetical protein BKI52_02745 [marine bacterium AO1-C]